MQFAQPINTNSVLKVYDNKATLDVETGAPNIELIKNGKEYQLNIYVRLQSYNQKGLKELLKLVKNNSGLYDTIINRQNLIYGLFELVKMD